MCSVYVCLGSAPPDFPLIDRSFGFDTAVEETQRAIICAKVEAKAAINGLGLVKVMGRASGQIAMFACLASRDVVRFLLSVMASLLVGYGGCSCLPRCVVVVPPALSRVHSACASFKLTPLACLSPSPGCAPLMLWPFPHVPQDVCLIPEIPFELTGPNGLFRCVSDLFQRFGHCVIVVAEGAGMELIDDDLRSYGTDASGNVKRPDIGLWLRARLNEHFASLGRELNLKLIEYVPRLIDSPALAGCASCRSLPRVVWCSCLCLVLPPSCSPLVDGAICLPRISRLPLSVVLLCLSLRSFPLSCSFVSCYPYP